MKEVRRPVRTLPAISHVVVGLRAFSPDRLRDREHVAEPVLDLRIADPRASPSAPTDSGSLRWAAPTPPTASSAHRGCRRPRRCLPPPRRARSPFRPASGPSRRRARRLRAIPLPRPPRARPASRFAEARSASPSPREAPRRSRRRSRRVPRSRRSVASPVRRFRERRGRAREFDDHLVGERAPPSATTSRNSLTASSRSMNVATASGFSATIDSRSSRSRSSPPLSGSSPVISEQPRAVSQ